MSTSLLIVSIVLSILHQSIALQCLNEYGENIDWWFIYKVNNGLSYAYYDASYSSQSLSVVSGKILSDQNTALAYTLTQIWNNPNSYNFIAYNDETPDGSSHSSYGHTKGVFGYYSMEDNGFLLIHSWPKFPNFYSSTYNVDIASDIYAQTFLCISYESYATMDSIAYELRFNKPKIYNYSNDFSETNSFTELLDKQWLANTSIYSFESSNNAEYFTLFSKSGKWYNALYENAVSPYYQQSFVWETWRRNPQEPSFCASEYEWEALNVQYVTLTDGTSWKYTQDHGKIGCSIMYGINDRPIVCVGDINRMFSQFKRGGGTCCFEHTNLWSALDDAFETSDECSYSCSGVGYLISYVVDYGQCDVDTSDTIEGYGDESEKVDVRVLIVMVIGCVVVLILCVLFGMKLCREWRLKNEVDGEQALLVDYQLME